MKDTKHIRKDFHSVTLVMPQGGNLGRWGCPERGGGWGGGPGSKIIFFKHGHVAYQINKNDE